MIRRLTIASLTVCVIAACQGTTNRPSVDSALTSSSDSADCRTIEHELGETEVCGQPQRIVVLGPYVLEPLVALDVQPVAFADHIAFHQGEYDNPSQHIPYLGHHITQPIVNLGTAYSPSIESILKLQPDLILGTSFNNADQYETLSDIAPTLLLNWDDSKRNLRAIGQAIDRSDQAEQLIRETEQQIVEARDAFISLVETQPKLLLLVSSRFPELYIGNQTAGLCRTLTESLGFEPMSLPETNSSESNTPLAPVSLEALPDLNEADSIILLGSNFSELQSFSTMNEFEEHQLSNLKQEWEENAIAQSLDASKAGRVYFIPAYMCLGLPGPIGTELYLEELKQQLLTPD
ncbi:MAG: iron-siderophore ABC transporter substrate-binding protein [Cyanobacteria bacterium J06627_8]